MGVVELTDAYKTNCLQFVLTLWLTDMNDLGVGCCSYRMNIYLNFFKVSFEMGISFEYNLTVRETKVTKIHAHVE